MTLRWVARSPGELDVFELEDHEVPDPGSGEVRIAIRAAGMNPADYKHVASGDAADFPKPVGYEIAGVVTALGPGTEIASGGGAVGEEVLAFRVYGGWAEEMVVPARDVFAKPAGLSYPEAANLLLAGTTAAEMLHVTGVSEGDTVLVHGASGAVGVSLLQQTALLGVRVVGTASESRFEEVRRFGGTPLAYGSGLEQRARELGPYAAALDCVGTDEAVDASLALVADRERIVTIANAGRAETDGIVWVRGSLPASAAYRDGVRAHLIGLAGEGRLVVPVARTYPLADALDAARFLQTGHPGGKVALVL
ncbi:putative oxidoreductase [Marmoricola endophyticus]|uniref:Oxidoreductase n=1 Tax=Marmoricola endophyticus TaxID=2040280 RepID=A0A917F5P8_9ACTN|nr:NADP-dependent oxidoreductase [Marmoricola endophyticus]GGF52360.1 putative oxidoreductase [Marmoricola endophyticus]